MFKTRMLVGAAAVAVLATTAAPAEAVTVKHAYSSCSYGTMKATLRVAYTGNASGQGIRQVAYRITDNGRNQGDIGYNDGGTVPAIVAGTGLAIQDGAWHVLSTRRYIRGTGSFGWKVTFDMRWWDHSCGGMVHFR